MSGKIIKGISMLTGAAVTVTVFNFANVGASDDISLQSPVKQITAAELHSVENDRPVYIPTNIPVNTKEMRNEQLLEDNTFVITSDDTAGYGELLDESLFTYDGSRNWISTSSANVRTEPNVTSDIVVTADYGTEVIKVSYGSTWSKVKLDDGTEGFVMSTLLTDEEIVIEEETEPEETAVETETEPDTTTPSEETESTEETTSGVSEEACNATRYASCDLNVRSGPGIDYSLVKVLSMGDEIDVVALTDNGWYKTAAGSYVKADLTVDEAPSLPSATVTEDVEEEDDDDEDEDTSTSVETVDTPEYGGSSDISTSDFGDYCMQFVGVPYEYGGASPSGFDCSGFVSYCMANYYGVSLPHNADDIAYLGTAVSLDSMQPGDVLCHDYNEDGYIDHVSLYIGNGYYIHASDSRQGVITTTWMSNVATVRRFI